MSRSLGLPSTAGGTENAARRSMRGASLALLLVLLVVGSSLFVAVASTARGAAPPASASLAPANAVAPALATHGDLVVAAGQTVVIHPTPGTGPFFQGGNITVEVGGTLVVSNADLAFVQYVSENGPALSRLSHIYHFTDAGTVDILNSTVTTQLLGVPNAYAKLNVTVTGTMDVWNSTLEFPGWLTATGAGATLTINSSVVRGNPQVPELVEPTVILGDTEFAPSILATNGATLNLFNATLNNTYADDTSVNAIPTSAPLNASTPVISSGLNITYLATPNDPANLTQDYLYPGGIAGGEVGVFYNNTNLGPSTATVTVWFAGVGYPLGTMTFVNRSGEVATLPFSTALTAYINHIGVLGYLNATGDFGAGASQISIAFTDLVGGAVVANQTFLVLDPPLQYNMVASGAGSQVNSVDSAFDLTYTTVPTSPLSQNSPYPWASNKFLVQDGASLYLANPSVTNPITAVFSQSAFAPDNTSTVYLYRWAAFNMTGLGHLLPVQGAVFNAYYSFNSNQANNATANALNALSTANPAIWGYVQHWDALHGIPTYATSGLNGTAYRLLASGEITGATVPDGIFLGGYHIGIVIPTPTNNTQWFNWSVSPYPVGVAQGTPHYGSPDWGPGLNFPSYFVGVDVEPVVVTANGTVAVDATVRIGQVFGAEITIQDTGTGRVFQVGGLLYYNASQSSLLASASYPIDLDHAGESFTFNLTWLINDSRTGLRGAPFANTFEVVLYWNDGNATLGGASTTLLVNAVIAQSQIRFISFTPPASTTIYLDQSYLSQFVLQYNGSQMATVSLVATPTTGGGPSVVIAAGQFFQGENNLTWFSLGQRLSAGTSYTLTAVATYNGVTNRTVLPGTYSVPAAPTSATSFLFQKFLGLPLWMWLAIAAAAIVAVVALLLVSRRQAAGKLVECGECGNLIPEDATVCPKCGAEFESDLIRCSRCASTIPADSKFCPECAAQLLGKPGEGDADPERLGYDEFTQKYRAEAKKELGENYNEGSFWDWWKRQPTYTSFSQWKLQQGQGTARAGMAAPPTGTQSVPPTSPPKGGAPPPSGGASGGMTAPPPAKPAASAPPAAPPAATAGSAAAGALKPCPNCGKEIPPEYLVCPFCGSVTQ